MAATRNPQEWLGALDSAGTVSVGKRADLLLLDGNPLLDITNTERRAGVMLRGKWFPQVKLKARLDRIAERFQHALDAP